MVANSSTHFFCLQGCLGSEDYITLMGIANTEESCLILDALLYQAANIFICFSRSELCISVFDSVIYWKIEDNMQAVSTTWLFEERILSGLLWREGKSWALKYLDDIFCTISIRRWKNLICGQKNFKILHFLDFGYSKRCWSTWNGVDYDNRCPIIKFQ